MSEPFGLLAVDKSEGPTSHEIVARARRALGLRRIGHSGTLDPFATGLLLLCLGRATRLAEYLTPLHKVYRGVIELGTRTDTDDRTGQPLATSGAWRALAERDVLDALNATVGEIAQTPPAYSAKKTEGRRAYSLARKGGRPKLEPARVVLYRIEPLEIDLPRITFELECSAGTYVRSFARDLGEALGCGGHLAQLRRTRIGAFSVDSAIELIEHTDAESLRAALIDPAAAVGHLPRVNVSESDFALLRVGQPVPAGELGREGPFAVFVGGRLAAIARWEDDRLTPSKVLVT